MIQQFSVSKVLSEGFRHYMGSFTKVILPLIIISVVYYGYLLKLPVLSKSYGPSDFADILNLGYLVTSLFNTYITCVFVRLVSNYYLKYKTNITYVLSVPLKLFLGVFVLNFLVAVGVILGLVVFIIPGVILSLGWYVSHVVFLNEPGASISSSIYTSWNLTKGNKGQIFFTNLVLALVLGVIVFVLLMVLSGESLKLMGFADGSYDKLLSHPVISIISSSFNIPITSIISTVVYFCLLNSKQSDKLKEMSADFMEDPKDIDEADIW